MTSTDTSRRQRADGRSTWPIRRYALGSEPDADLAGSTTAAERLAMMWELARQAWALSGRAVPDCERRSMPGRVVRRTGS